MENIIQELIDLIKEESREANISTSEFSKGKKLAYYELLDVIYNRLVIMGYDPNDFGLDRDPFIIVNRTV